jgi:F0F1-type ATP synthase assembly protein I
MAPDDRHKRRVSFYRTFALAMELPLIIVLAPVIGFALGQWLDTKLGTSFLSLLLGIVGFAAGVREVLRRIPKGEDGEGNGQGPGSGNEQREDENSGDANGHDRG